MDQSSLPKLIIPLDFPDATRADIFLDELKDLSFIAKVGLELFTSAGPDYVRSLVSKGYPVFLDLKLHDIPNTVSRAAAQVAELGVSMFTIHLSGGEKMVRETASVLAKAKNPPILLGVSVLTSLDDEQWKALGNGYSVAESVDHLVKSGVSWGVDGIVCSPFEVEKVKKAHPDLYTVVPGIRPVGAPTGDQARVMTPGDAISAGASAIVVGRPITQAELPRSVAQKILSDIEGS